jgi:pantoate ligase / CMP/dCMP kinase
VRLFTSIVGLRCYLNAQRLSNLTSDANHLASSSPPRELALPVLDIGFVPTMGALHKGHLSLIQRARRENKIVIVSIFVNPLQFAPTEDLQRYPRPLDRDRALCEQAGVDALFVPTVEELGIGRHGENGATPQETAAGRQQAEEQGDREARGDRTDGALTQVLPPARMTRVLCGISRPGHFAGVAAIVTKLFNIVQPTRAYLGQKDAQQLAIIRQLVRDLNIAIEVVGCPIVREASGLALSSRNQYLTELEHRQAATLYQSLKAAERLFDDGERSRDALIHAVQAKFATTPTIAPEYVELVHPITLEPLDMIQQTGLLAVAARLGTTRLIDNLLLSTRKPIVAIDGPAGAGKSTVARLVAEALELFYLDTGAMYRAITWLVLESGVAVDDEPAIAELVSQGEIELGQHGSDRTLVVLVNGQDVTHAIRSLEVTSKVSEIAAQPTVRQALVHQQQRYGEQGGIVIEGRDIGTYVFPDAEVKIFLTASVQERARRRYRDLITQGMDEISLEDLERTITERDYKDSTRRIAPLCKAEDAIELNTDGLSIDQVTQQIVDWYRKQVGNG